ncbi:recombination regulator RecX [Lactobacillus corticis]|uniref:Regulatory protein RecX n=1 Tax=Lactobacillus corticis TaxID=2201249 RepID=A0A916VIS0_9LACO|nr:recombination regulator RecX [Lactobacillus corticis]GFZ26234.1 regulatory protein RecX [Lactobacillus corticis]
MPIITKVSRQKRPGRYNIFLDGQYAFSVSEKTLAEYVLLKGQELSEEKIEELKQFDQDAKVSELAAHYLSYQPRTIYEVLTYLDQKKASPQAAQRAVSELSELGYLDDSQYAKLFIKNNLHVGTDGPNSLRRKLQQKGVQEDIIENRLAEVADSDWLAVGQKVVKSLNSKAGKISQRELGQKMRTKLLSHGFSGDLAQMVLDQAMSQEDSDQQLEALKQQGIKAYKRTRRYQGTQRQQKMRTYLYQHGFSSGEIDAFLNGEIIPWDELEEY